MEKKGTKEPGFLLVRLLVKAAGAGGVWLQVFRELRDSGDHFVAEEQGVQ